MEGEEEFIHLCYYISGTNLILLNYLSKEVYASFTNSKAPLTAAASRPDGKVIAYGNQSGDLFVIGIEKKLNIASFEADTSLVSICFINGNLWVASMYSCGTIRVWELSSKSAPIAVYKQLEGLIPIGIEKFGTGDSTQIVAVTKDGTIVIFETDTDEVLHKFELNKEVTAFSVHNDTLLLAVQNTTVRLALPTFNVIKTRFCHTEPINTVNLTDSYVITGSTDCFVKLFNSTTQKMCLSLKTDCIITTAKYNEEHNLVLYGLDNGQFFCKQILSANQISQSNFKRVENRQGYLYFFRGRHAEVEFDLEIENPTNKNLNYISTKVYCPPSVGKRLERFEFKKALFTMMKIKPNYFMLLVEDLITENVLIKAVNGLTETEFLKIVTYIKRYQANNCLLPYKSTLFLFILTILEKNYWIKESCDESVFYGFFFMCQCIMSQVSDAETTKSLYNLINQFLGKKAAQLIDMTSAKCEQLYELFSKA